MREVGQHSLTPKSKESKRLYLSGCKVYSTTTQVLQLRIAYQQAILSRYNFNSWNSMLNFRDLVPTEFMEELGVIVEVGKAVARTSLQASLDAVDSAADACVEPQSGSFQTDVAPI